MRRIALLAVLALAVSPLLWAQEKKADAPMKSDAKMEMKTQKATAPKDAMAPTPVFRRLTARSREDARECLNLPTNQEIIVCAEKFL
jgi:hypothetical protein